MFVVDKFRDDTLSKLDAVVGDGELLLTLNKIDVDDETCKKHYFLARNNPILDRTSNRRYHLVKELCQTKGVNLSRLDVQITLQQEVLDKGWEITACKYAVGFLRVFIDRHL